MCHSSSSGATERRELLEVVLDTYPDTFSHNANPPPPKKSFLKRFSSFIDQANPNILPMKM